MMEASIPSVLPTTSPFSVGATAEVRMLPDQHNPQGSWAKCRIIGTNNAGQFDVYMLHEEKSIYGVAEENLQLAYDDWTAPPVQAPYEEQGAAAAPVPAPTPGEAAPAPAPAPGPGFEAPTPEPQRKAPRSGGGGKRKVKRKGKKKAQVVIDPAAAAATAAGLLAEAKANGTEPPIYKCEYFAEFQCDFCSENFARVQAHEKECGRNPFHSQCQWLYFSSFSFQYPATSSVWAPSALNPRVEEGGWVPMGSWAFHLIADMPRVRVRTDEFFKKKN